MFFTLRRRTSRAPGMCSLGGAREGRSPLRPNMPGLVYTLREGATLKTMGDGATKQGDGQPWTPTITVKGGPSGFYTIKVDK